LIITASVITFCCCKEKDVEEEEDGWTDNNFDTEAVLV
jgi:hypothetical protein